MEQCSVNEQELIIKKLNVINDFDFRILTINVSCQRDPLRELCCAVGFF